MLRRFFRVYFQKHMVSTFRSAKNELILALVTFEGLHLKSETLTLLFAFHSSPFSPVGHQTQRAGVVGGRI